jgi:anti-anti-sigma regulatory factor
MASGKTTGTEGTRSVVVSGEATVGTANKLKQALLEALESANAVHVVFRDVTAADVTLPQLLCAAHRAAVERNKTLTVEGADRAPLNTMLRQTGFLRHIGCQGNTRRSCLWIDTGSK